MRGPFLTRMPSAGLSLGAALFLASCAAPPTAPPPAPGGKPQATSIDGATVEFAAFQNSAFPYRGLIPNYQETGRTRPFLDVDDNGRLGHSSPRGGLLWEDQTYNDRTVLLAAPQGFNPAEPRSHRRLLSRQQRDAATRRRRPPADRAPARRVRA